MNLHNESRWRSLWSESKNSEASFGWTHDRQEDKGKANVAPVCIYSLSLAVWSPSQYKYLVIPCIGFPIMKMRWSLKRLIFIMGIHILVRRHFILKCFLAVCLMDTLSTWLYIRYHSISFLWIWITEQIIYGLWGKTSQIRSLNYDICLVIRSWLLFF